MILTKTSGSKDVGGVRIISALRLPSTLPLDELISCQFIQEKKNLVLYGPVGTGKTHLAIALGTKACEMGIPTRFFTAASLVTKLSESKRNGSLERTMKELEKAQLLVIDEWGYLPMDREEAQLRSRWWLQVTNGEAS